jgi:sugar transferase (PEP-CTERM/EpsH1 system associated)
MSTEKRVRVCHVLLSLRPGGLENGVVNVVNGLESDRIHSSICALQQRGEFANRICGPGIEIVAMGLRPGNDVRMPLRLAKLFRKLRTDVVHTRNAEALFYGVLGAKLAGVRHIIHSEHGRTFPEKPMRALVQRCLMRFVDYSFAVSARLKEDLAREIGVDRNRLDIIYNGVDFKRFSTERPRSNSGRIVIGSVGRLELVKNYALLIRAMAAMPPQLQCRLVLVGDGSERARLESLAMQLGVHERVEFAGHRDDVPHVLQGLDVFVLPSLSEGMSNTILEAMASGAAIVASDVGGNRELIEHGVTGLLFASNDVEQLIEALTQMCADILTRQRLALAASAHAREKFSMEAMLARYEEMYRNVARGGWPCKV